MDSSQVSPHFISNCSVISGPPADFIASMEYIREYNSTSYASNDFAPIPVPLCVLVQSYAVSPCLCPWLAVMEGGIP